MKKYILFFFLFFAASAYSQDYSSLGIVRYQNQLYHDCKATRFEWDDDIIIHIFDKIPNFNLYFTVNKEDFYAYNHPFFYNNENKRVGLNQKFTDWDLAEHHYSAKDSKIYLQHWENDYFTISGTLLLDNLNNDSVQFSYFGQVKEDHPEVVGIRSLNFNDPKYNNGKLFVGEKIVEIPFAFFEKQEKKIKLFFMDRMIFEDRNLEYATSFTIDYNLLPTKKDVTLQYNNENLDMLPAFFNQNKTEIPEEAVLTIKKPDKKEIYQVEYSMKLENGTIIKGNYKGKLSDMN